MKISMRWLQNHIDLADFVNQPEKLVDRLNAVGLEVDAVNDPGKAFQFVVVGLIERLDRHPNADRLTVCQLNVGDGSLRQIVCGAKNHKVNDKVVVCLPGAVLPGDFAIKKSKIRDVESLGMLASESELGLKAESEGILILPADAPIGAPFAEYYGLNDIVFEINVSPNRADCLSHFGLARELSVLFKRPLKTNLKTPAAGSSKFNVDSLLKVQLKAADLCTRYTGRIIRDVKVGPTPDWLKKALESVGLKSINNVVDITNWVMMDLGQPLHAFDFHSLQGQQVIVDRAQVGEKFKTLDNQELELRGDELTIRNAKSAACLAGVMGGLSTGVGDQTKDIFLEAAHFTMDSVRKTSRRFGMQTDSAYRFSRGVDPSSVLRALNHAAEMIREVAGGQVSADAVDLYPKPFVASVIELKVADVSQKLGYNVDPAVLKDWFERLNCKVEGGLEALTWKIVPPDYRVDLNQDVDLIEEYGRLQGYENIPTTLPPMNYEPLKLEPGPLFNSRLSEVVRTAGFSQCVNYGFVNGSRQKALLSPIEAYRSCGLPMEVEAIAVRNPLNEDLGVMRVSLMPGLLQNLLHNFRHGSAEGCLFEIGQVFRKGPEGYAEDTRLGLVLWGLPETLWQKTKDESFAFYDLKSRLRSVLDRIGLQSAYFQAWRDKVPNLLHPAQAAQVFVEGRSVGYVATVHPEWSAREKVRVPAAIAELDVSALGRGQPRALKFKPISRFPAVERDLAFVLPPNVSSGEILAEIKKSAGAVLQSVEVFDVFKGGDLPAEHVSVAFRMVWQDATATLNEEQLTGLQKQIVAAIQNKYAVSVR